MFIEILRKDHVNCGTVFLWGAFVHFPFLLEKQTHADIVIFLLYILFVCLVCLPIYTQYKMSNVPALLQWHAVS